MSVSEAFNGLSAVANFVTAAAAAAAVWLAVKGVESWRRETIGRRRIELAEQVLADFYEAEAIISEIRSPWSFGGEGAEREGRESESEDLRQYRDMFIVPLKRVDRHAEFFSQVNARRYRVIAAFGKEAGEPYSNLFEARGRVISAARTLLAMGPGGRNTDLRHKLESDVWERYGKDKDEVSALVAKVVADVETRFRPVIQAEETARSK